MVTMGDIVKRKRQLKGLRTITDSEIKEIQSYYDEGNSLINCVSKYGYCKGTLIKYLNTRNKVPLTDEERKQRRISHVVKWRIRTKQKLVDYKGGKCSRCGYDKYIGCLTFHHRDPEEKEIAISSSTKSFEALKKEVDKCDLVCHNCHGEIHAGLL